MRDVFVVDGEHHYLPTCPCIRCGQQRRQSGLPHPYDSRLKTLSVAAATLLFNLPRCEAGSLARELTRADQSR